jgi:hypothetical protein
MAGVMTETLVYACGQAVMVQHELIFLIFMYKSRMAYAPFLALKHRIRMLRKRDSL